jgi:hypothetical protein
MSKRRAEAQRNPLTEVSCRALVWVDLDAEEQALALYLPDQGAAEGTELI